MFKVQQILDSANLAEWEKELIKSSMTADALDKEHCVLAVDGDIIAYKTAAVCEQHFEGACAEIIDTTLKNIAADTGISLMRIYISGDENFRYKVGVTKPYKGNRATMVAPQFLGFCKRYLQDKYGAIRVHGYEADDGIATDMAQNNAIHCGIDKDILQVPGRHYNYIKKEWKDVSEDEGRITLYRQILMGDTSDNVPGLPKVGEKTAEAAIQDAVTAHDDCVAMYMDVVPKKLGDIDPIAYMNEQAALITMVTSVPLQFDNTTFVKPNETGFERQEGDFEGVETNEHSPRL